MAWKKRGNKRVKAAVHREKHTLPPNNIFAIIVILFILTSALSSYLTYTSSMRIAQELTGEISAEAKLCVNKIPAMIQSCATTATVGTAYYCDVDATDADNDTVTFYDNATLFDIDQNTGEIIFTPSAGDEGIYSILLTASDGGKCANSNVTEVLNITITTPTVPPTPPPPAGGGGGGGGIEMECSPQWECTRWGPCSTDGKMTRTCYTLNNCLVDKPAEEAGCIYVLPPKPRIPAVRENYLCNFDIVEECYAEFGEREDWIYTYKQKNSTIHIIGIDEDSMDASIDYDIMFNAQVARIKSVDVTGDEVPDFEYIVHDIDGNKAKTTVRLVKQYQSVVERPVYIETLPYFIVLILMFVYENACLIFLIVLILAAILIYSSIMKRIEQSKEQAAQEKKKQASHKSQQ